MEIMIFLLLVFLAIVYVYSFLKIRNKKKATNNSTVIEFKEKYLSPKEPNNIKTDNSNYNKYITKYNSSVDYINKEDLYNL